MTFVPPDAWSPIGVEDLEDNAWQALREIERNVCISAGAGSGKSEFLAQKATYLLQTGICPPPKRILAISFKRDAARILAERVGQRCTADQAYRFDSVTFEAFAKGLVDRFRLAIPKGYAPSSGYLIEPLTKEHFTDFLNEHQFYNFNARDLERLLAVTKLPVDSATDRELAAFWSAELNKRQETKLSFSMLNRLAEYLLRSNPSIRRAIHATYPFVFLDEFQDTTEAQYQLLQTAFAGSKSVFTAVGDDKQRIMGWAGAMNDSFSRFSSDYNAQPITLLLNWRSHEDLVHIQHQVAKEIDPKTGQAQSRAQREVEGEIAAIWQYPTSDDEIRGIANWIASEIRDGLPPHEIGILVRQRADKVESAFASAFQANNIKLRNFARNICEISIQDLLSEPFTEVLLPLLRLGASMKDAQSWSKSHRNLQNLEGAYYGSDFVDQQVHDRLEGLVQTLEAEMRKASPEPESAISVAQRALDLLGVHSLRSAIPSYQRDVDFERVKSGFLELLKEGARNARNWNDVLDQFEGLGHVSLMTIHKSKGHGFHTTVFYGLNDTDWWSL